MNRYSVRSNRHSVSRVAFAWGALGGLACGSNPSDDPALGASTAVAQEPYGAEASGDLPPGYGTLKQDDFTVPMVFDGLQMKITPLREWVIRLSAPDTYRRLSGYKTSLRDQIEALARQKGDSEWPQIMLVQLFTREPERVFEPMELELVNQSFVYRPLGLIPITPDFGSGRIKQNQTQLAVYLFPSDVNLDLPVVFRYREARGTAWEGIRQRLDQERALVRSRVASAQGAQGQ